MKEAEFDRLRRFHIPELQTRGVWSHLDSAWRSVGQGHGYPPPVRSLLGQALAATTLLAGNLKSPGRLSLQLRSTGGVRTLFAECDHLGHVRGIARLAEGYCPQSSIELSGLPDPILVITLERPEQERYQGLIAVESGSLGAVLEAYFAQSEQLPTRVWLDADESRCGGLLLQQVAADPGHVATGFPEAEMLASTLRPGELLELDSETLVRRLFAEHDKHLEKGLDLLFACSCSRERVGKMFESLGRDEAFAALKDDVAEVRCDFCNRLWVFDRIDLTRLFMTAGCTEQPPPTAH